MNLAAATVARVMASLGDDSAFGHYMQERAQKWMKDNRATMEQLAALTGVTAPQMVTVVTHGLITTRATKTIRGLAKVWGTTYDGILDDFEEWARKNPGFAIPPVVVKLPRDPNHQRAEAILRARTTLEEAVKRITDREYSSNKKASAEDWYEILKGEMRSIERSAPPPVGAPTVGEAERGPSPRQKRGKR